MNETNSNFRESNLLAILRWVARIWGGLVIAFVLFFVIAHILDGLNAVSPKPLSELDMVTFIFFPGTLLLGLATAYKSDLVGGIIAVTGSVILFFIRPDLIQNLYFSVIIIVPGILYLVYGLLKKGTSK